MRGIQVEHGAERVRRIQVAVLIEVGPAHLVIRDRGQARVRPLRGVGVELDARRELVRIELHVAHPHPGLLAVRRIGMLVHELGEVLRGFRIRFVREDHPGVEEHGVEVRKVAILGEHLPVELE